MVSSIEYKRYRRRFRQPYRMGGRTWHSREGLLIRMRDDSVATAGFGECAPLPGFSTETVDAAHTFMQSLRGRWHEDVPRRAEEAGLPSLRFALETARNHGVIKRGSDTHALPCADLLPAGGESLERVDGLLEAGFSTFKWKIGRYPVAEEQRCAERLFTRLHRHGVLRLDANASLDADACLRWMRFLREFPVEFLEQPMGVGREAAMLLEARRHQVPVALDESVAGLPQLERFAADPAELVCVVKPSLVGSPDGLRTWAAMHPHCRRVYSTALETSIGIQAGLQLAAADTHNAEAVGYGVFDLFEKDGLTLHEPSPRLNPDLLDEGQLESIWNAL